MMSLRIGLGIGLLLCLTGGAAHAQTQVKPRVMLMVDTSGSMSSRMDNNTDTNADQSISYADAIVPARSQATTPGQQLYPGAALTNACTTSATYETNNANMSRMFNAKAAVTNVINGSGDIDWGLMRYAGTNCAFSNAGVDVTPPPGTTNGNDRCNVDADCKITTAGNCDVATHKCKCGVNSDCNTNRCSGGFCSCNGSNARCNGGFTCSGNPGPCVCTAGSCTGGAVCQANGFQCVSSGSCTTDFQCADGSYCVGNKCITDPNQCNAAGNYGGDSCNGRGGHITYNGACGTGIAGGSGTICGSRQTCYVDADCTGTLVGRCSLNGTGPTKSCINNGGTATCPANYVNGTGADAGRCIYSLGCRTTDAGVILADPASLNYSSLKVLPFVDNVEVFTNDGTGNPTNPELRADGFTPLAGAARTATAWYNAIKAFTQANPACDPATQPLCDKKLACRPYVFVQITDGADTCDNTNGGSTAAGPAAGAQAFVAATVDGARQANKVYVIGLAFASGAILDAIAYAGGTTNARLANSQAQIEAALADIVASSVLFEQCNGSDDTCDGLIDEGLGVYEDCTPGASCKVGSCPASGRCTCNGTLANQCDPGFACNNPAGAGFCVPTCTVGVGACLASGVRKCGGSCCVNDGAVGCTAVVAGTPGVEICNNIDDNCNGAIDEGNVCTTCLPSVEVCNGKDDDCVGGIDNSPIDVGLACGSNIGVCTPGVTSCVAASGVFPNATDHLVCVGGTGPSAEVCDGKDNNCDGVVDGMTQACYSGAPATRGVGACRDGAQACTAVLGSGVASWGPCLGEVDPLVETCNGVDDNCDGIKDNVAGTGGTCCSSGKCGVGVCVAGTLQCSGGSIQCVGEIGPSQEICDGFDNDCNGVTDDVIGKGSACTPAGSMCGGHLVCNNLTHTLDCVADAPSPEICNGVDDDCDGLVDESPDIITNDSRINQPCDQPVAPANLPPCKAGATICQNGSVVCSGEIGPKPNVCGQPSQDCETSGVFNGNCPSGFQCFEGTCAAPCSSGEFPCPGGFVCKHDDMTNMDFCISDACGKITCPDGQVCQLDAQGNASCFDPCSSVTCPGGFRCSKGLCVDDSCLTFGCPNGQVCVNAACEPDPCFNVVCDANQYCSPTSGTCVNACLGPCPSGEQCVNGLCTKDPCAAAACPVGQACLVSNGVGMCVTNQCGISCIAGQACCGGMCVQDACSTIICPAGSQCSLTAECNPTCVAAAQEKIVGAGGGGFACDVAGGVGSRGPLANNGVWLLFATAAWLLSRRRRAAR